MPAHIEYHPPPLPPGCVNFAYEARDIAERHFWMGDVGNFLDGKVLGNFLDGKVFGLTTREKMQLSALPSESLEESLIQPILAKLFTQPERQRTIIQKAVTLINEWTGDDTTRRQEAYSILATSAPYDIPFEILGRETSREDSGKDYQLKGILKSVFSEDELIEGIKQFHSNTYSVPSIAASERTIQVFRWKMEDRKSSGVKIVEDKEKRKNITSSLLPFAKSSFMGRYSLECIGEIIVGMTPVEVSDEIPNSIWWLALASLDDDVLKRAKERISFLIDIHNDESINILLEPIGDTQVDFEHQSIWWQFNQIISHELSIIPGVYGDKIFKGLANKITDEYVEIDQLYPSSVGSICGALDHLLSYAQDDNRGKEIFSETEAVKLAERVLALYLQAEPDADNWTHRTRMINFASRIVSIYPHIVSDENLKGLIAVINDQPEKNYAPPEMTQDDADLTERKAVEKLVSQIM